MDEPLEGVHVNWCDNSLGKLYGYYEISVSNSSTVWTMTMWNKCMELNAQWGQVVLGSAYPNNFEEGSSDSSFSTPSSKRLRLDYSTPHIGLL